MLHIKQLHKAFHEQKVLKEICFSVEKGEVVVLLGASGSGKTTLLRTLNYLEQADGGTLSFPNFTIDFGNHPSRQQIKQLRNKFSMVFQSYNLFIHMTALQNVMEGLVTVKGMSKKEAKEVAESQLELVNMKEHAHKYPSQLSGGQQQRVGIARALAMDSDVLLFDEPTSALDPELVQEVLSVMKQLAHLGKTMIVVTHEMRFAKEVADRVLFLENGSIVKDTTATQFFSETEDERVQKFLHIFQ